MPVRYYQKIGHTPSRAVGVPAPAKGTHVQSGKVPGTFFNRRVVFPRGKDEDGEWGTEHNMNNYACMVLSMG